jgi:Dolichyl-phosphate-mannose-protein mannosyltransferase
VSPGEELFDQCVEPSGWELTVEVRDEALALLRMKEGQILRESSLAVGSRTLLRTLLLLGATALAFHAFDLLRQRQDNFDKALVWDGAALALLVLASLRWEAPGALRVETVGVWLRRNRLELAMLAVVVAGAIFMRLYGLGTFPPSDGTGFEEPQTGGNAFRILNDGERPIEFAFTNYVAALGFSIFGYDTSALRLPFLVAGTLSLIPFYLLVRLLVGAPAALFSTALFAACRWHAVSVRFADEIFFGLSIAILAALLLVLVLKSANALAAIPLGLAAGALNYEYSSYRHLPFLIAGAVIVALAALAWGRLQRRERAQPLPAAGRELILASGVFAIAAFIVLAPLLATTLRGDRVYYEAFVRHQPGEQQRELLGVLPADWERKAAWTLQVFLPFGRQDYPEVAPMDLPGERMLDPITATLAVGAAVYGLATSRKPYRLFFVSWLLLGLLVGGLIPKNFYVDRFSGLLPPLFVLIAFFIDDVVRRLSAMGQRRRYMYTFLAPLAAAAMVMNLITLDKQMGSDIAQRRFVTPIYSLCDFIKHLGPDTYSYVWAEDQPTQVIFGRSDYDWICHGIAGETLNTALGTLPVASVETHVAFVFLTTARTTIDPAAIVTRSYANAKLAASKQSDAYTLRAFVVSAEELMAQRGLKATFLPAGETDTVKAGALLRGDELNWPAGATYARLEGLVLMRRGGELCLGAGADTATVFLDGAEVCSNIAHSDRLARSVTAGWHSLDVVVRRSAEGVLPPLAWLGETGAQPDDGLRETDFFAVAPVAGWRHEITARFSDESATWQTIEPSPGFLVEQLRTPSWLGSRTTASKDAREQWRTLWHSPSEGEYELRFTIASANASVHLDGVQVAAFSAGLDQTRAENVAIGVTAGQHILELVVESKGGRRSGVSLDILGASGSGEFEPY